ncbi:hypothetical protein SAMN04244567_03523 [Paracoccus pantotrophus]|nr:hypothetical protein SAMN04244567_03523 [Paracoccus pantotrophus]
MRRHPPARPRRPKPCCPRWRSAGPTSRGSCGQASQPIDDGRGEGAGREKQDGAAIVAGCDPTPALEMCEHVFDPAAQAIAAGVARDRTFPADAGGDAWRNASFDQGIAKPSGPTASNACRASSAGHRPQGVRPAHPNNGVRGLTPQQPLALNEDYPAQRAPVIGPRLASGLRKERPRSPYRRIRQPGKLAHHPSQSREFESCTCPRSSRFMGHDPRQCGLHHAPDRRGAAGAEWRAADLYSDESGLSRRAGSGLWVSSCLPAGTPGTSAQACWPSTDSKPASRRLAGFASAATAGQAASCSDR